MPVVFIPGKGNVQFPDDMDMDTIRWTIENRILPGVAGGSITEAKGEPTLMGGLRGIGANIGALPAQAKRLFIEQAEPFLTSLIRNNPFTAGNALVPEETTRASVRGALDVLGIPAPPDPAQRARDEALYGKIAARPEYEQEAAEATAAAARAAPQYEGLLPRAAYSAASSLIQMSPGLAASVVTRNPLPAYANIAAITAPEAYQRYRDRGGTAEEAALGAAAETGIEIGTEMIPLGFAVKQLGRVGFGKFLGGYLGRELPSELIATITQNAVDTAIANPDKTWGEYLQELPGQLAETAVATGLTAGALAGVGKGVQLLAGPELPPGIAPPPPGAPAPPGAPPPPVAPPNEGLLGALGTPGGTVYLREGDGEAPYIYRGVDDTGRILIEDEGGNIFAEDPSDLEGAVIRSEPPAAAPEPPVAEPPAAEPPVVEPPLAEPPIEQPLAEPPVVEPPPAPPSTPPAGPLIEDDATRQFWSSNLARQRGELTQRRDALAEQATSLQEEAVDLGPEDIDDYRARQDDLSRQIDDINARIAAVDEDITGVEQGQAPIPRARPLDDNIRRVVDTPDQALVDAIRDKPATAVMDWFADNASTDFHREVAKRVGNLMKAMENAGFQFNWGVYNQSYQPKDEGEKGNFDYVMKRPSVRGAAWTHSQEVPGKFGPGSALNKVDIGVKDVGLPNSGANEVTILHEFAHAVTVAAIQQLRSKNISPNSRVGKAVKELQSLKRAAVTFKNKTLKDMAEGKPVDPRLAEALRRLENTNAWKDEKELIVQGLSNIDMQVVLKAMPYQKTNGFVEFIRQIGRLIGVSEKDMNGLRRLFELTDELIPTDTAQQQDVIQAMMKPKEYGVTPAPTPSAEQIEPQAAEGVDEFTLDEDIQQAIYSARKVPSLSRRVDRLVREWRAGRMTDAEFMAEVADWSDYIGDVRQGKAMKRKMKGRARGADYIRQRLLEAKRRGELAEDAADFAEWFIKRNPALVDDLGIAMRQQKGAEEYIGRYNPYGRVMTLLKNSGSDTTAVHEILHHLERMMPEDVQGAIRDSWWNATQKAAKAETKPKAKAFFNAIKSFYMGDPLVDENGKPVLDENKRPMKPSQGMDVAMDLYNKHLGYDYYEHVSPSEFWAVRATDIVKGRYDVQGSTLGRLKGWLRDAGQYIKGFFGLPSNAPILKALKSLSDSDGKYVSTYMLADLGGEKAPIRDTARGKNAPSPENTETRFTANGVNFDQEKGLGQVGNNQEINYFGFTAMMSPSRFLELAEDLEEPKERSLDYIRKTIEEGGSLGSPYLRIDFDTGEVIAHEGRHRMTVIGEMKGDAPIPVHILGAGGAQRARHLDAAKIEKLRSRLTSEDGKSFTDNFGEAFLRGETLQPGELPTGPSASALLTPEDEARQITEEAAVEPERDTAEVLKEAAKPIIKVYNMRSEMQEKSRGCD